MKLVRYEAIRVALDEARRIDDVKEISDQAVALRAYARQKNDVEMVAAMAEIHLRAARRIGEISRDLDKAEYNKGHGTVIPDSGKYKGQVLREAGVSTSVAHRCEQVADLPETEFESYIQEKIAKKKMVTLQEVMKMVLKNTVRAERVQKIQDKIDDFPDKKYSAIYADPPWKYYAKLTPTREIEHQYQTMELDAIKALPVSELAAPDCVLFLWATAPGLEEAIEVLNEWGFEYRSCAVWVKNSIGAGQWFRQQHEILLLGVKGKPPVPIEADRHSSVFEHPRMKHSKKPDAVAEMIERCYGGMQRIELFCRQPREGWDTWGNENDGVVSREV